MQRSKVSKGPAYRWGALALLLAAAAILTALGFEHIGKYAPCPLCLQQRWAYYVAIPATFAGLVLLSTGRPHIASAIFALVALAFLANAGLGTYHAGVEWGFWPGPDTCAAQPYSFSTPGSTSGGRGILDKLPQTGVVRCDEAQIRVAGLSFAGWNVVACLMLFTALLKAAFAAREHEVYL